MRSVAISSGHGTKVPGAVGYINEVTEATRVVDRVYELLQGAGVKSAKFHDTTSTTQNQNLNAIVNWHNAQQRDLDVSVHFNCYQTTTKPMGEEVLYVTQQSLANDLAASMASASGLINRGGKKRTDLFFLNNTTKPAILIEVCFVDSKADVDIYDAKFEEICKTITEKIGQVSVSPEPEPEPEPPVETVLQKGSTGPEVKHVQELLYCTNYDGDFGDLTDRAVKGFQRGVGLQPTGIVDAGTWAELDKLEPIPPPVGTLSPEEVDAITQIAAQSAIASYSWRDRGRAPIGYIKGVAVAYGMAYRLYAAGSLPFIEIGKANTGNASKDVAEWYLDQFNALGMRNDQAGIATMRHMYAFMIGLGMRESSGKHCEGRDTSASNTTSDTAEAGLFQTSWNARSCSPDLMQGLFDKYAADPSLGYMDIFAEGVSCSSSSWSCYGSGNGYKFQEMCKKQPEFAVETCGIVIRNLRQHYGPINRKEVELKREADEMLQDVERILAGAVA